MSHKNYWYIACAIKELTRNNFIKFELFNEPYLLYKKEDGSLACIIDRCLHRGFPLSQGLNSKKTFQCGYHGWKYDENGNLINIPSLSSQSKLPRACLRSLPVIIYQDYVFVNTSEKAEIPKPFSIPQLNTKGWGHIRLKNLFENSVTQCLENFLDVPHTAWVHPGIFRKNKSEALRLKSKKTASFVTTSYHGEKNNLGFFSRFLNPTDQELIHTDTFFSPNISCVFYSAGPHRKFYITSQAIPTGDGRTWVFTDLTYNYGIWNMVLKPIIRWHAQKIIKQDQELLRLLYENTKFANKTKLNTEADMPLLWIAGLRSSLEKGIDLKQTKDVEGEVEIRV